MILKFPLKAFSLLTIHQKSSGLKNVLHCKDAMPTAIEIATSITTALKKG